MGVLALLVGGDKCLQKSSCHRLLAFSGSLCVHEIPFHNEDLLYNPFTTNTYCMFLCSFTNAALP